MESRLSKTKNIVVRDPETGRWLNPNVFRQEAIHFMKYGFYCPDPPGSISHKEYWDEQLKRCIEGYEVNGVKITGHHYMYLNFTQIELLDHEKISDKEEQEPDLTYEADSDATVASKITSMPDFWDGDYDYYWSIEIAKNGLFTKAAIATTEEEKAAYKKLRTKEERDKAKQAILDRLRLRVIPHPDYLDGGNHIIVGKSRRKGYSYKNAAICANIYNTQRKSITIIGAFDKKYLYPSGTMGMASNYLDFLNKHTAYTKAREKVDQQEHKRASFEEIINGAKVESGYQSEIIAVTFGDNPDAARGKDAKIVLFEESGKFPNLEVSYKATQPGLTAGKFITGQMLVFGTGGDMEKGTVDFAKMFYNPLQYKLMPFRNIWDENASETYCGFFHPVYWNMEGFYDEQGNSFVEQAIAHEKKYREELIKNSTDTGAIQSRVQEFPLSPSEAFLTVSVNDFPVVELRNRLNKVKRENLHLKLGQPCHLYRDEHGKVVAKPILEMEKQPLWDYQPKTSDLRGAPVIYEYPISNPPKGLYKIGFDPYRQAHSSEKVPSLAAIYVYKSSHKFSYTRDTIVAQYVGRPSDPDDVNRIAEMFAELYNTEVMYENEVTHVKDYFVRRKKAHLLASQPDTVISKLVNNSKVNRVYGIHMNEKIKDGGEKYIKQWLLRVRDYDETGQKILNLDTINDPALLEELISYNRKGNFDRVMSFMMVMFQLAEEEEGKIYGEAEESDNVKDLLSLMDIMYKKNG